MTTPVQLELDAIKREWIDENRDHVLVVARILNRPFTTDDLHLTIPEPEHAAWWGCLLAQLKNTGAIVEAGRMRSARPEANGRKVNAWRIAT